MAVHLARDQTPRPRRLRQTDPADRLRRKAIVDPLKDGARLRLLYFIRHRATAYVKHPDSPAWLFETPIRMKPMSSQQSRLGAGDQDVMDLVDTTGAYPSDQINADPRHHRLPAISGRHRLEC